MLPWKLPVKWALTVLIGLFYFIFLYFIKICDNDSNLLRHNTWTVSVIILQCFNTHGWMTGKDLACKNYSSNAQSFLFGRTVGSPVLPGVLSLCLHFNSHFPGEPGLAGVHCKAKDDGGGGDNWSYKSCNQSDHHHQQTNIQLFLQAGWPSCHPTNIVKALKAKYHIPRTWSSGCYI